MALTNGQQFLQAGLPGASPWLGGLDIDDFPAPTLQAQFVAAADSFDADAVWTVDDRPTMESLTDAGVDGIITDRPDILRELMADRGLRLPRAYAPPLR